MPTSRRTFATGLGALVLCPAAARGGRVSSLEVRVAMARDGAYVSFSVEARSQRKLVILLRNEGEDLGLLDAELSWSTGSQRLASTHVRRVTHDEDQPPTRVLPVRWAEVLPGEPWAAIARRHAKVPPDAVSQPLTLTGSARLFVKGHRQVRVDFAPVELGPAVG